MQNDVTIVVPAHNEEAGIGQVLADVKAAMADTPHSFEIVVVDDSSTDRTAEIARESGVTLYQHSFRRGYGEALKTGIRIARSNVIVTIDADGTYPCDVIPTLLARLDGIAMVVGARIGRRGETTMENPGIRASRSPSGPTKRSVTGGIVCSRGSSAT